MYELVKYCISFNCFSSLSFECKECTFSHKEFVDIAELTSKNIKRDSVEPSFTKVQEVHRNNFVLSS
jgi:hypothetical protein